jgi:sugar/nucleoside kinase (ribokinase family)
MMGCVGRDDYARIIEKEAKDIGVRTVFQTTNKAETATCHVLLTDNNR